jgi:hypothetical protein
MRDFEGEGSIPDEDWDTVPSVSKSIGAGGNGS